MDTVSLYDHFSLSTLRILTRLVSLRSSDPSSSSSVPTHLYTRLAPHHLLPDGTPDYLKLILLSKTYAPPLNMKETPLTKAVNLSTRLGVDIWLKREDAQEVFSFKIRGAYNFMSSLGEEERWKGVVTCSAGEFDGSRREAIEEKERREGGES